MICSYFSPRLQLVFSSSPQGITGSIKVFNLEEAQFMTLDGICLLGSCLSSRSSPRIKSQICSPMFSSKMFIVPHLTFKFMIYFELTFICSLRIRSKVFCCCCLVFACGCLIVLAQFVENNYPSSIELFLQLYQKSSGRICKSIFGFCVLLH